MDKKRVLNICEKILLKKLVIVTGRAGGRRGALDGEQVVACRSNVG